MAATYSPGFCLDGGTSDKWLYAPPSFLNTPSDIHASGAYLTHSSPHQAVYRTNQGNTVTLDLATSGLDATTGNQFYVDTAESTSAGSIEIGDSGSIWVSGTGTGYVGTLEKDEANSVIWHSSKPEHPNYGSVYLDENNTIQIYDGIKWNPIVNQLKAKQEAKKLIKSNLTIIVKNRHKPLGLKVNHQELKARDTLRDLISEQEYRRYITNGFLMIKSKSNKWYQVFNDQRHINVYEKGKKIKEICIHTDSRCPPTDHVLNMKILIETDENLVWKEGNVHQGDLLLTMNAAIQSLQEFIDSGENVPVESVEVEPIESLTKSNPYSKTPGNLLSLYNRFKRGAA